VRHTPDLGYALDPWRRKGLPIAAIDTRGANVPINWPTAGTLGALLHRARLFLSLKSNSAGGYGAFVPESSGG
jgi:hypothetical protein